MLSDAEIRRQFRSFNRYGHIALTMAVLPGIAFGVAACVCGDGLLEFVRNGYGETAVEAVRAVFLVLFFALLVGGLYAVFIRLEPRKPRCPACRHDLSMFEKRVVMTRCCPKCSAQIVVGRIRSLEDYRRLIRIRQLRPFSSGAVTAVFWSLPVASALFLAAGATLMTGALVGVSFAGVGFGWAAWTVVRRRNRRCLAPGLVSLALLIWQIRIIAEGFNTFGKDVLNCMRILVTGGAGYIGSHTVRTLLKAGHAVTVFDNLSMGHRAAVPAANFVVGDLKDVDHLDSLFVLSRIEAVVHFAAFAFVGESVTDPAKYYLNNLVNSVQLLERCRKHDVKRFVFSSTCATYGVPDAVPITEATPQRPINPYGHSKLAFEQCLRDYAAAYQIGVTALRYFNAAGASSDGTLGEDHTPETHLIPLVLQVALGQRPHIEIFGTDYPTPDGTCIRDYIHVEDLAEAHRLALDAIKPGVFEAFNVGVGSGASVRDVIAMAEAVTGSTIAVKESLRRPGDPAVLVAAAEKIRMALGWTPKHTSLKAILESAWRWHLAHPKGYTS